MKQAKFITFEGVDASGKTTLSNMLCRKLHDYQLTTYKTFEPTDGPIGSLIRNILNKRIAMDEKTIAALFLADRLDHLNNPVNGIIQYLEKGISVISDRYYYSSYAYHVPHLSLDWLIDANKACAELARPDIVFFIDISVEESMRRLKSSRQSLDLFETSERISLVRENYQAAIKKEGKKDNVVSINGERKVEEVFDEIWKYCVQLLEVTT